MLHALLQSQRRASDHRLCCPLRVSGPEADHLACCRSRRLLAAGKLRNRVIRAPLDLVRCGRQFAHDHIGDLGNQ